MLVGEIGIDRRAFLYDLRYWEVLRIIKGYRRRGWYRNQLIGIAAFSAMFCMGNKDKKTPKDIFPELFSTEDEDESNEPTITEEEAKDLQKMMANYTW